MDFTKKPYADGVRDLVNAISRLDLVESADNVETKIEAELPAIYVEDIMEFIPHIPRWMLWRIMSLRGAQVSTKLMAVVALRPPGILLYWAFWFVMLTVCFVIYAVVIDGIPLGQFVIAFQTRFLAALNGLMAIAVVAGVITLIYALSLWVLKLVSSRVLPEVCSWYPYRPVEESPPNRLLDSWHSIKPIMWQLVQNRGLQNRGQRTISANMLSLV